MHRHLQQVGMWPAFNQSDRVRSRFRQNRVSSVSSGGDRDGTTDYFGKYSYRIGERTAGTVTASAVASDITAVSSMPAGKVAPGQHPPVISRVRLTKPCSSVSLMGSMAACGFSPWWYRFV